MGIVRYAKLQQEKRFREEGDAEDPSDGPAGSEGRGLRPRRQGQALPAARPHLPRLDRPASKTLGP
eukprot:352566-Pyramimonas_sp.AAC.1